MKITRIKNSRIHMVDFDNLPFGKVFTDHMLICEYKDGNWGEPEILPYGPIPMTPALHALHYGQAVFEGMKAYRKVDGTVSIFRPEANFNRLNRSAERMTIPTVPKEIFMDGLVELIKLDYDWVPFGENLSLYIRPFLYASSEFIAARPSDSYVFCILLSPSGPYYSGSVKVKIEERYVRSADGGVGFAKAAGNYGAAFYPTRLAQQEGYTQIIWTDHKNHHLIEESGTMNIAVVIDGVFRTPALSERILAGITRDSILTLLNDQNFPIKEGPITVDELVTAAREKRVSEMFGMGTAAVISPISHLGFRDEVIEIPTPDNGLSALVKKSLTDIRLGKVEDTFGWMYDIEKPVQHPTYS
ncbi:branched-chain amino acid aminotransferase [Schleiferia thermophila]|jgi:branched-chain amino acid aminotransferase|nr:branched-chain amino acid aminotransferase [Schleiferia thermophila]KFD39467.1 branched-chain amino acid aminotransferase [Schleiferia thermophila str. Yellowstone]PMB29835.1 branched chain amino acid aminotransferase [Fischerella thermalis CCMEE 5319]GCD79531.1 branched-chain-amino-acid aminotransferase [Schleiferia thermophila]